MPVNEKKMRGPKRDHKWGKEGLGRSAPLPEAAETFGQGRGRGLGAGQGVATPSPTAGPAGPHAPRTRPSWESAWNCWESPSLGRLGPGVTNSRPEVPPQRNVSTGEGGGGLAGVPGCRQHDQPPLPAFLPPPAEDPDS